MGARLSGRLLGGFEVSIDGRRLEATAFERPSGSRLLKLLLATPGHRVRREEAAELLWPEADPERSAANLRKAIHFARRALEGGREGAVEGGREGGPEGATGAGGDPAPVIRSDGEWLRFDAAVELDLDVDRLRDAIRDLRAGTDHEAWERPADILAELAGAEMLPEDPYDEWLAPIRERLRAQALEALAAAASTARAGDRPELAFRLVDRLLELDPADEGAHRLAIQLHLDAGHLHAARRQLAAASRAVAEAYGVEPSTDLQALVDDAAAMRARMPPDPTAESPLVGRRHDLEVAEAALDAVAGGTLGVVVYRGPAGIGKSRVLRELVRSAGAGGWRIVEVRGLESSPDLAFGALASGLATGLAGGLPAVVREPGRSALLTAAPSLRGAAAEDRPAIEFASDGALAAGILAALADLAAERPLVLALDDVQWLDAATLDVLAAGLRALGSAPVLILATMRDAPEPPAPRLEALLVDVERAGGRVARLGPILPRELTVILERDLPAGRLEPAVAAAIAEQSNGAPLYALEILRAAREGGLVVERAGTWRFAGQAASLPVPRAVHVMVGQRTERLPQAVARVLSIAAELGDEVTLDRLVVAAADHSAPGSGATDHVLAALDDGLAAGLIVEHGGGYAFAHPLFRAALRGAVRPRERAELHARVARALAEGAGPTAPEDPTELASDEHGARNVVAAAVHAHEAAALGRSDAIPIAIRFGFAAGSLQAAVFDFRAAVEMLERSLALWSRLPREEAPRYPAATASMRLGWSRHAIGDEAGALAAFRAAARQAPDDRERAAAWQAAAWMPYQHGQFDVADAMLAEARAAVTDPIAIAGIDSDRAWILGRRGQWRRAHDLMLEAVRVLEAGAPAGMLARSLDRLGVAMRDSVDASLSIPILERAHRLAREARDERLAAVVRMHLAGGYRRISDQEAAMAHIEAALESCAMTGDRYIEAVTTWIGAEILDARGDLEAAIEWRRRELAILGSLGGNEHNQAMAHAHVAHLAGRLGDRSTAAAEAALARTIAGASGLGHLPARIDRLLEGPTWFDEDPPAREHPGNAPA